MNTEQYDDADLKPWIYYTVTILEVWITFCIAAFSMAMYFSHFRGSSLITTILMVALFLFVIMLLIKRLVERLSVAALMLLVPIAPLMILLLAVALVPIIQYLRIS